MRYVVLGAGAVGGTIGGRLHQHGHDVVLIARGAHHDALRDGGLRLQWPGGSAVLPVPVAASPAQVDWRPDDVVVIATKTQDTAGALDAVAAAHPDAPVVCAQNGVVSERMALRRFERVYGVCVMLPADHLEPGVVRVYGTPMSGILDLGRYPEGVDDIARRVATDLESAEFSSRAEPAIMRLKYRKLIMNLGNAIEAACGPGARGSDLYARARDEALAVLAAAGIDVATEEEDRQRRDGIMAMKPVDGQRRQGGSSWQSLARGTGTIEAAYLNGEIVLLGRLHGVPVPVNAGIQRVALRLARERRAPGSLPVEELEAALSA
jgi:2-dehydropantoate 2-reductase